MPTKFHSLLDEFPIIIDEMRILADHSKASTKFKSGKIKIFRSEEKARKYIKENYRKLIRG